METPLPVSAKAPDWRDLKWKEEGAQAFVPWGSRVLGMACWAAAAVGPACCPQPFRFCYVSVTLFINLIFGKCVTVFLKSIPASFIVR